MAGLVGGLIMFLIVLVVICFFAGVILWAVGKFFPEIATPARYAVGAIALILILLALYQVVTGGSPALGLH